MKFSKAFSIIIGLLLVSIFYNGIANYASPSKAYSTLSKKQINQANKIAKRIAKSILEKEDQYPTDFDKVQAAADIVAKYYDKCKYTTKGKVYYTAYGVFVAKKASCAGAAQALGLVIENMGYKWTHVNKNKWTHQWVKVKMDGKTGYADSGTGMIDPETNKLTRFGRVWFDQ